MSLVPVTVPEAMRKFDLAIVGAGPAGMAAALEARGLGLSVVVIDENAAPGGQVFLPLAAPNFLPMPRLGFSLWRRPACSLPPAYAACP